MNHQHSDGLKIRLERLDPDEKAVVRRFLGLPEEKPVQDPACAQGPLWKGCIDAVKTAPNEQVRLMRGVER